MNRVLPCATRQAAFSRVDLVVVCALSFLLAGLGLSTGANTRASSGRALCVNNLRQVGLAHHSWGGVYGESNPWTVPQPYGLQPGGGFIPGAAWITFYFLSKQLRDPRVLVCPSSQKMVARDWDIRPGGFRHGSLQNNAVSYFNGLHAMDADPLAILSGDGNLRHSGGTVSCWVGINNASTFNAHDPAVGWTNNVHFQSGNILLMSGEVRQSSNPQFQALLRMQTNSSFEGAVHALLP